MIVSTCMNDEFDKLKRYYIEKDIHGARRYLSECDSFQRDNIFIELFLIYPNLDFVRWIFDTGYIDLTVYNQYIFRYAVLHCDTELSQWLYSLGIFDPPIEADHTFYYAGYIDNLPMMKWLHSITVLKQDNYYEVFYDACISGNIKIAEWLFLTDKVDIRRDNDLIFKICCQENIVQIVELLCRLTNFYICKIDDNKIVFWRTIDIFSICRIGDIRKIVNIDDIKFEPTDNFDECLICHNVSGAILELNCNHYYCLECIVEWIINSKQFLMSKCPYCTKSICWSKSKIRKFELVNY